MCRPLAAVFQKTTWPDAHIKTVYLHNVFSSDRNNIDNAPKKQKKKNRLLPLLCIIRFEFTIYNIVLYLWLSDVEKGQCRIGLVAVAYLLRGAI